MDLGNKITKSGAYIIDPVNKKILIIISNTDPIKIGIPKGSIEDNEKIYECAEREIREETGLEIRIINKKKTRRIFDGVYFFIYINNGSKKFIPNPNKLNKREIKESKWVDINFLEENKAFCNVTLKKYDNIINLPYLKYNKKSKEKENNKLINKNKQSFCMIL
jgi:8-oxo-dGTP pyrophosphatase MutT (NUDIX family)